MGAYSYDSSIHAHAVISNGSGWSYQYDLDGNMTRRDPPGSDNYDYAYDAENRLYQASKNGSVMAVFTYDGDGARVKSVMSGVTTGFVGSDYETSGGTVIKYFLAGGGRIAMRSVTGSSNALTYLFGDQLSSTSATYRMSDGNVVHQLYKPWGEVRYASASLATAYTYTGQYNYTDDIATPGVTEGFGFMFYNARWLNPQLGRWNQPDIVIPEQSQGVQAWDRYAYVNNSPLINNDPSGHMIDDGCRTESCSTAKGGNYQDYVKNVVHNNNERKSNAEKIERTAEVASFGLSIVSEPYDWAVNASDCINEICSPLSLVGLLPVIPSSIGKYASDVIETTVGHHSIPRQILKILPPDLADAVRGVKGAPNIWQIPKSVHSTIHSGPGGGCYYNAAWRIAMDRLKQSGSATTASDIFAIRDQLTNAFGLFKWGP